MAKGLTPFKRYLRERGIAQQALAKRLKISNSLVSSWARGQQLPSPRVIRRVADALGISTAKLLTLIEESNGQREPAASSAA